MSAFWVRFSNGPRALCVEAKTEDLARERAATIGVVKDIRTLPYPAHPRLEPFETHGILKWNAVTKAYEPSGETVVTPEFCYTPDQCAGRTCCPKSYACSE